ncbi:C2H2-type zinc finger protein [Kistimonas scapharcae]|uniref:C2H2-type zinc finger protein n=1 Tax=Kistimonas scapharcae TaxID=1036133 RepID=UPI0031E51CC5
MTPTGSAGNQTPQPSVDNNERTKLFRILDPLTRKQESARTRSWSYVRTAQAVGTTISTGLSQPFSSSAQTTLSDKLQQIATPTPQPTASSSTQQLSPRPPEPEPVASTSTETTASIPIQQSTSPAPQPVAVAGTSGVQSGYSQQADKKYQCNTCSYLTIYKHVMKAHVRRHTGEKPYKCQHCDYSAAQQSNLNSHMRTKHPSQPATDTNQPPAKKPKTE